MVCDWEPAGLTLHLGAVLWAFACSAHPLHLLRISSAILCFVFGSWWPFSCTKASGQSRSEDSLSADVLFCAVRRCLLRCFLALSCRLVGTGGRSQLYVASCVLGTKVIWLDDDDENSQQNRFLFKHTADMA